MGREGLKRLDKLKEQIARSNAADVEELTSRKSAVDIPKILDRLEYIFDPAQEQERKLKQQNRQAADWSKKPLSVVLATNMISVGRGRELSQLDGGC